MKVYASLLISTFFFFACSQAGSSHGQSASQHDGSKVQISTEYGDIVIRLYDETPIHRDNFIKLAKEGFFDGTLFHRVINQFMIQGGDPLSKDAQPGQSLGSGGPGYTLPAEILPGVYHKKGAVAAARQGDQINPERRSSGSQFYIVHGRVFSNEEIDVMQQRAGITFSEAQRNLYSSVGGAPHLDGGYTIFGEVISGLDVVDRIAGVQTAAADRPVKDIQITVTVIE